MVGVVRIRAMEVTRVFSLEAVFLVADHFYFVMGGRGGNICVYKLKSTDSR